MTSPPGTNTPSPQQQHYQQHQQEEAAIAAAAAAAIQTDPALLTPGQRLQLKKEKARVYSARARRRQERYVAELRASVDVLMVYRYLLEWAPDLVLCLTADAEGTVLYANPLAACALGGGAGGQGGPATVVGR